MRKMAILVGSGLFAFASLVQATEISVDQVGQKFSQPSVKLKNGDMMHFLNRDDVTHNINVIDSDDAAVDKGLQKPGETIEHKFDAAGDFVVRCSIHPKMKMSVKVS
jgi:plastocyanin